MEVLSVGAYAYIESSTSTTKSYARTLFENYRAKMVSAGHAFPTWDNASPALKREFIQEAKQVLS